MIQIKKEKEKMVLIAGIMLGLSVLILFIKQLEIRRLLLGIVIFLLGIQVQKTIYVIKLGKD